MARFLARLATGYLHILLLAYWLLLFISTHLPMPDRIHIPDVSDKIAHFVGYFGLGFLASAALLVRGIRSPWTFVGVFLCLTFYGAVDELLQHLVPGRHADTWDWLADTVGAACGIAALAIGLTIRNLRCRFSTTAVSGG